MYFLREYVLQAKKHKYLSAPKPDDYLTLRQRGTLEGMAESLYRLNSSKPAPNAAYGKTGTYDIASRLGLYNPATSFTIDYTPKRNPYQKEKDQYDTEKNNYSV